MHRSKNKKSNQKKKAINKNQNKALLRSLRFLHFVVSSWSFDCINWQSKKYTFFKYAPVHWQIVTACIPVAENIANSCARHSLHVSTSRPRKSKITSNPSETGWYKPFCILWCSVEMLHKGKLIRTKKTFLPSRSSFQGKRTYCQCVHNSF